MTEPAPTRRNRGRSAVGTLLIGINPALVERTGLWSRHRLVQGTGRAGPRAWVSALRRCHEGLPARRTNRHTAGVGGPDPAGPVRP